MKHLFAEAGDVITFLAPEKSYQSYAVAGPFQTFADAWEKHPGDTDEIERVLRSNPADGTCWDITEDCAEAWLRLYGEEHFLRHAPAFIDRDEAEARFEHEAREATVLARLHRLTRSV